MGKGVVESERVSPAALTYKADGGEELRGYAQKAGAAVHLKWSETHALVLRRGPYVIAAGLADAEAGAKPVVLEGRFVDLFDENLPVKTGVTLSPGVRELLYDVNAGAALAAPKVIAAACRVRDEHFAAGKLSFWADGIDDTNAVVRIASRKKPARVAVGGKELESGAWEFDHGTVLVRFANSVEPVKVEFAF